jgi:FkbM family methyltransferase
MSAEPPGSPSHPALLAGVLDQAIESHRAGRFADAEELYRQILALEPDHFESIHLLGLIEHQRGNHADAVRQINAALGLNPRSAEAFNNRGIALKELKRYEDAIASYDQAIALKPGYAEALNNRGIVFALQDRLDEALASYDAAIAARADYADAFNNRGNVLRDLKRTGESLASYEKAIRLKPAYAEAFANRGNLLKSLGRLDEALSSYEKAIAFKPDYPAAFHQRAATLKELGRLDDALASYDQAIALRPGFAAAYNNRGNVLKNLKRHEDALESYDQAIAANPRYADAYNNRGILLADVRRFEEALASYQRAIALRPNFADAFNNRGNTLTELNRLDEARASYDQAIAFRASYPEAFNNRANLLKKLKRYDEALKDYDSAIALRASYAEAFSNRGNVLIELKRYAEALASYDQAVAIRPRYAEAHSNRGNALLELRRLDEALAAYEKAIALKPDYADAHSNRGNALLQMKRLDEAMVSYTQAIAFNPAHADARKNRGMVRLLMGDFREGWADYELRFESEGFPSKRPNVDAPLWHGEDIAGRSILISPEQGLGDIIQFARYLPLLSRRSAKTTFGAPAKLARLLKSLAPEIEIVTTFHRKQSFDYQCALMSLPFAFGTDLDSIPRETPYLAAEEPLFARWKAELGEDGFKIGIAWRGSPKGKVDQGRSFPLALLEPLSRLAGVRLLSLQKQHGLEELTALPEGMNVETLGDFDEGPDGFIDTAAVMKNLDLIVTSDTSIAHLAGALGKPTWIALKYVPDWRWLLERADSPWYPTVRLFRQPAEDEWEPVFSEMEQALASLLAETRIQPVLPRPDRVARSLRPAPPQQGAPEPKPVGGALFDNANLRLKRCRHGTMMFYANDQYIGRSLDLYGEFSEREIELFAQLVRPGMTVVDAGANIGAHTLFFASVVGADGRVFAFEPQRALYQILCGNVAFNLQTNVVAVQAGLGAEEGTITVPKIDYGRGGNFGGVALGKYEGGEEVPLRKLDSYALTSCHLIKIDVEGMEKAVLEGARATLERQKPLLYVENDRKEKSSELIRWLFDHDYRLYWHTPRMFNPENFFGAKENVFGAVVSLNMLCVPKAQPIELKGFKEITSPDEPWPTGRPGRAAKPQPTS